MDYSTLIYSTGFLAVLAAVISAARATFKTQHKGIIERFFDILTGAILAYSVVDLFVNTHNPKLAGLVGLVSGALSTSLLDAVQSAAPGIANSLTAFMLKRFGIGQSSTTTQQDNKSNDDNRTNQDSSSAD